MEYSIFYSWQSDTSRRSNKDFIREALAEAVATKNPTIEDWPVIESGMERVPGTPEIATIMFEKIRKSSIFVADVTLVGNINPSQSNRVAKRTPNPNVLLEMGYAAGTAGWSRIICIMNEHFGKREDQPIDVRNRRYPISYTLDPSDEIDEAKRSRAKTKLVRDLQDAIETLETAEHAAVDNAIESLDTDCMHLMQLTGRKTRFVVANPTKIRQWMNLFTSKAAITRLIGFRFVVARYVSDNRNIEYSYHWTYLGKLALVKLGIRSHLDDQDPPESQ